MTVEEGDLEKKTVEGKKSILVGIQMDSDGRDLLNWAIGKIVEPGDRVVAVHVYRKSDLCNSSVLSITRSLDNYLAEYQVLCDLKKVALMGRIVKGSSIKKVIVKEAELCGATTVVVGVNKSSAFRGSASLAKFCAKKLPRTTYLLAVHSGKVIFERGSPKTSTGESVKASLGSFLSPSLSMNPVATNPDPKRLSTAGSKGNSVDWTETRKSPHDPVRESKMFSYSSLLSPLIGTLPEATPGWPLRRAVSVDSDLLKDEAARNMSVVQWVMNLPDRSQPSPKKNLSSDDASSPHVDLERKLAMVLETCSSSSRWFTRAELENSTNQFSSENLIGNGGCSEVYMGHLPDGLQVAVKTTKLSEEAFAEFLLEAEIITTLQHEHIIPLMGVGIHGDELISVYNFFSKGSLEENLHGKSAKPPLPWEIRFKVALGIAEALNYLHKDCTRPVIHRDIKSSNILLSNDFEPKLSDFGLAIWAPKASSCITHSDVVGTFGYLAPEYFMYGKVSDKIDVYSFGVVLLELLTGRKPIRTESSKDQESLVMWVTKMLEQGDLTDLLDPSLESNYDEDQVQRMIVAATICIRRIARLRPRMSQVLSILRGESDMSAWTKPGNAPDAEEEVENQDEEAYPPSSVVSHLGLAFQDVDDAVSISSMEQNYQNFLEEYLRGRWSRSSSFD